MTKLIITDQTGAVAPQSYTFESGKCITDILRARRLVAYADSDRLYLNGVELSIVDCEYERGDSYEMATRPLGDDDTVTLIQEVKGIVGDAFNLIGDITSFAFDLIGIDLTPDIPEVDTGRGSPNNSYQSQTNIIRAFAQRPLVCGSPRIFPDLIGEAIESYTNNIKRSEQYFELSFGDFQGGAIRAGNTVIGSAFNATVTRYQPANGVTTIADYRIGQSVDEVDGQTVRGTNEGGVGTSYPLSDAGSTGRVGTTFTAIVTQDTNSDQLKSDFDAGIGDVRLNYSACIFDGAESCNVQAVSGTGRIDSMVLDSGTYTITINNFNGPTSFDGNYTVTSLSTIISGGIGPFSNPIECEKMLFNIIYRQGLNATVEFELVVYELDGPQGSRTGVNQTFTFSHTADQPNDPQNLTEEITIQNGRDWYEFELTRTNEESQDTTMPDVPTLESVYCIQELQDATFVNATMLRVIMQSTQLPTSGGVDNRINITNGMMSMPSYDLNTRTITPNAPSRDFADAILFIIKDFYGRDPASFVNLDELYTLRNAVAAINPEFVQFDYTFDDAAQSLGERIDICCNVARIYKYFDGNQLRFWRDQAVTSSNAILGRADIAQEADRNYTFTRQFFVEGNKESVQVEYINRTQNKPNYIYRTIQPNGTIVNTAGDNPKQISLLGCQSQANAENRANLEIRKILYNHTTISDTFLKSQNDRSRGDVVLYNEIYETGDEFGGVITGIEGNDADTDNIIMFDPTKTYQGYFTNSLGVAVGPQTITPRSDGTTRGFTATDLSQAYAPDLNNQMGSRYYITETATFEKAMYRVLDKQLNGPYVQLTCVNYDARTYEMD